MKIIIDVMSGDNAPLELIRGALLARDEIGEEIILVGDEAIIRGYAESDQLDLSGVTIVHANSVIHMDDHALSVVREKSDSSMSIGLHMLAKGEGDAFVSAGNTGALVAGATLIVRRIKGIQRAGIAAILPFPTPCLLMDCGANLEVTPANLEQFAFMGSRYMEKILGVRAPRVGLLNNGSEEIKGRELEQETYAQLFDAEVRFVGNVEASELPFGVCDVVVTDGYTGNIVLKYTEGAGRFMLATLKEILTTNILVKLSAASMKGKLDDLRHDFDPSEYGGAPLLGIAKPVIKAHGSSDARAIKNAIFQAIAFHHTGLNQDIALFASDHEARMRQRAKLRGKLEKAKRRQKKKTSPEEE